MENSLRHHSTSEIIVVALVAGLLTSSIYWVSAWGLGRVDSSKHTYFDYQAEAFLQGHTYLAKPPVTHDLTSYQGRWYVPFPPLPAFLLLPWVAVSGVAGANAIVFSALMGGLNTALAFLLLQALTRRGWTRLGLSDNLWLTALWGLGSVHWYMSTLGTVWFISQICTVTFILLAVLLAVAQRAPLLAGVALGVAMWGRPHVALTYPFMLAIGLQTAPAHPGQRPWRFGLRWGVWAALPVLLSGLLLLGYNALRFDNPFDFGYLTQNVARELIADLRAYGQFNLHYASRNLWAMWLALPVWDAKHNMLLPVVEGMSLALTTPALIYLFRARQHSPLVIGAWVSTMLIVIPLALYYNTGWWQFGYRFSLDFMTPVLVLLAVAAGARVTWPMRILILVGLLINAWGTWWFLNPRFFA